MSKIKVRCPGLNNGMSYKVLSEQTYREKVRCGKMDGSRLHEFLRYVGEFPFGDLRTLDDKFGEYFVNNQLIADNIRTSHDSPGSRKRWYAPGCKLAYRLHIRDLANTKFYDRTAPMDSYDFGPTILQRAYKFICDLFNPPKTGYKEYQEN